MPEDNEETEYINYDESTERSHIEHMNEFKEKVFPLYKRNGFTLPQAMIVWQLVCIQNTLSNIEDR